MEYKLNKTVTDVVVDFLRLFTEIVSFVIVIYFFLLNVVFPINQHSFFISAIEQMYMVRTNDEEFIPKKQRNVDYLEETAARKIAEENLSPEKIRQTRLDKLSKPYN